VYHTQAGRLGYSIGATYGVELVEKGADMELGGMDRDSEAMGNGLVGSALSELRQHLEFTRRQGGSPAPAAVVEDMTTASVGSPAYVSRRPGTPANSAANLLASSGSSMLSATRIAWRRVGDSAVLRDEIGEKLRCETEIANCHSFIRIMAALVIANEDHRGGHAGKGKLRLYLRL
jgi:hypothetical protein